jgi:hypothetical protein
MGSQELVNTQLALDINRSNSSVLTLQESPKISPSLSNQIGAYDQLNQFFVDQNQEQRSILEAREILGNEAKDLTDDQVFGLLNEIQYLVDSWLEEYETTVFDGKTLDELLGLK